MMFNRDVAFQNKLFQFELIVSRSVLFVNINFVEDSLMKCNMPQVPVPACSLLEDYHESAVH